MNPFEPSNEKPHYLTERARERRWKYWIPFCTVEAQRREFLCDGERLFSDQLEDLKKIHKSRLQVILSRGINYETIRRSGLDDPRRSIKDFMEVFSEFVERRSKYLLEHARRRKLNLERKENDERRNVTT